jgi:drug/metabolite transporter (DMT)-like permease
MCALAIAGSLWGTAFLFGKIAFREMAISTNVALRFLFGSLVLLPLLFRKNGRFRRRDFRTMVVASIIGIPLQFLIQFKGLALTTVSHASLMVSTLPVLLALTSAVFLRERLRAFEWCVLGLSSIGAGLISVSHNGPGPQPSIKGDLLVVVSMVAAVVMTVLTKKLMNTYDPLYVTSSMIVTGTVPLLIGVGIAQFPFTALSAKAWLAVAAQGILATAMAYLLWNWGMARVPAARAGIFFNMEPLVGTILGVVILHETLGRSVLAGGALILAGAGYFSMRPNSPT